MKEEPADTEEERESPSVDEPQEEPRIPTPSPRRRVERQRSRGRERKRKSSEKESESRRDTDSRRSPRSTKESREKRDSTPDQGSPLRLRESRRSKREERSRSPRSRSAGTTPLRRGRDTPSSSSRRPVEPEGPPPGMFQPPAHYYAPWWGKYPSRGKEHKVKNRGVKNRERNLDIEQHGLSADRKKLRIESKKDASK